jgi:DNA-binding NtrC family response regulator
VIAATHRDLPNELAVGRFREDLYYRLNVARIVIPPLRDRPEDILPLAEYILRRLERKHGWGVLSLSPEVLRAIQERTWPGNVRRLDNTLAGAVIVARGRTILPEHLDVDEAQDPTIPAGGDSSQPIPLSPPCWPTSSDGRSSAPWWPARATAPRRPNGSGSAGASSSTRSASTTCTMNGEPYRASASERLRSVLICPSC